ncbi:MAG: acyl-CoA carboxylase epsilon subunit [Gordonia sp. (in: high G+C Gram-positive bacteria)]
MTGDDTMTDDTMTGAAAGENTGKKGDAGTVKPESTFVRVVGGNPTDEDIAALLLALAGLGITDEAAAGPPRDAWGHVRDRLRPQWGGPGSYPNRGYR